MQTDSFNSEVIDALHLIKTSAKAKFVESIDIACHLGIDPKQTTQNVRGSTVMPYGLGKKKLVFVVSEPEYHSLCLEAGADKVGAEDLIEELKTMKLMKNIIIICSPGMIQSLSKIGKTLGTKGLMPNVKLGTVTSDLANAIKNAKFGLSFYRSDKYGIVRTSIGNSLMTEQELASNLMKLLSDLNNLKPVGIKGVYFKSLTISSTMGKSFNVTTKNIL